MKAHQPLLALFFALLAITSCKDKENEEPGITLGSDEESILLKVGYMAQNVQGKWGDFDYFSHYPIYVIIRSTGTSDYHGYIINPPQPEPENLVEIELESNLTFYRADDLLSEVYRQIDSIQYVSYGLGLQGAPYFFIQQKDESSNFYDDYKNQDLNWLPLVLTHDLFHAFQFAEWSFPMVENVSFYDFPIEEDLMSLSMLLSEIMAQAHTVEDQESAETYLKYYLAIKSALDSTDNTDEKLFTRSSSLKEYIEGSARYVEQFTALNSINTGINSDPTHGWQNHMMTGVSDSTSLRIVMERQIWYHIGAGLIHLLDQLHIPFEQQMMSGEVPYQIAVQHLNLSQEELMCNLEEAKLLVNWDLYVEKAAELYLLMER